MNTPLILAFPEFNEPAHRLAESIDSDYASVDIHQFPDGESLVRLPAELPEQVAFYRSLDRPNEKLVELMFAAETARELGAAKLTLVAPYLCYMRQDTAFQPGQAVSQRIFGRWMAGLFDRVITVDPHLHRTPELGMVLPHIQSVTLSASGLMGTYLKEQAENVLLMGPDEESRQWVQRIAESAGLPFRVAEKIRLGDRAVEIRLPEFNYANRTVVLVDDVVSTGHTLATAARLIKAEGAYRVHCMVTHPLFCGSAIELLRAAGVDQIWSTDSIIHATNVIELAPLVAEVILENWRGAVD
jgi:ribose-phosphate pyrophosphokinase